MEDPAPLTEAPKVFLDMVVMDTEATDMERDLLSQATDMAVDTLLSTRADLTTMDPMDITSTILMARDPLSQDMDMEVTVMVVMDMDLDSATNMSPDHTPAMDSMLPTLTKHNKKQKTTCLVRLRLYLNFKH